MLTMPDYFFAVIIGIACTSPTHSQEQKHYDVPAYVWPAYHPDVRFKDIGVFNEGNGEWEAVYNAKPKFTGHNQPHIPLWGYTNEADPRVAETKIHAALSHGINTFIYDWYWYDGRSFLENGIDDGFLKAANCQEMQLI